VTRRLAALVLLAALAAAGPASAGAAGQVVAATLDNGLRVLLLEDRRNPIVSFQVWYRVGARDEVPGATGLAHFLEHLMFKGTPRHGPREFARLVERQGGQDNAFTTHDVTSYFVNIAADRLDLVLGLEADRMQNLLLDPREIESERRVVIEERRTRTDDDPSGFLAEEVAAIAFRAHPYGRPVIGWLADLERITPAELRAFYRAYYVPNNALVVAVGDFDAANLLARVRAAFGTIPRGPEPPRRRVVEPPQNGERRVTVTRPAELPIVYLGWHVPNQQSPDAPALELLSTVLSGGRASRLWRHLVQERTLALDAGGDYSYFSLDPNLFWFWATPLPGQTPETLERALEAEMERLKSEPVGAEELQRAKNQIEAAFVFQADSVHRRASLLARFELIGGWALADRYVDRIRAVTADDLRRVARTYFPPDRKNVGVLLPRR
jgi:zinc protease